MSSVRLDTFELAEVACAAELYNLFFDDDPCAPPVCYANPTRLHEFIVRLDEDDSASLQSAVLLRGLELREIDLRAQRYEAILQWPHSRERHRKIRFLHESVELVQGIIEKVSANYPAA